MRILVTLSSAVVALVFALAGSAGAADLYSNNSGSLKDAPVAANPFTGIFVDGFVGGSVSTSTFSSTASDFLKPTNYSFAGFAADADIGYRGGTGAWRYEALANIGGQSVTLDNTGLTQNLKYGAALGAGYVLNGSLFSIDFGYTALQIQGNGLNETLNGFSVVPRVAVPLIKNVSFLAATEIDYYPDQTIKGVNVHQLNIYPKIGLSFSLGGIGQ